MGHIMKKNLKKHPKKNGIHTALVFCECTWNFVQEMHMNVHLEGENTFQHSVNLLKLKGVLLVLMTNIYDSLS